MGRAYITRGLSAGLIAGSTTLPGWHQGYHRGLIKDNQQASMRPGERYRYRAIEAAQR